MKCVCRNTPDGPTLKAYLSMKLLKRGIMYLGYDVTMTICLLPGCCVRLYIKTFNVS